MSKIEPVEKDGDDQKYHCSRDFFVLLQCFPNNSRNIGAKSKIVMTFSVKILNTKDSIECGKIAGLFNWALVDAKHNLISYPDVENK